MLAAALTVIAAAACPSHATCTTVTVPLDRSGAVAGSVRLAVARTGPAKPKKAPVFALTGGPGQGARGFINAYRAELGEKVVRERGLVAFDSRGSGDSGAINCPAMQKAPVPRDTAAAEACANQLGERRRFYSIIDQAEDVEAVRAALKLPKISLFGISYGTKVALVYARLHPDRVDRLVLDSVVPAEGASALSQEVLGAMPRVLEAQLPKITALVDRLRAAALTGPAIDGRGRRRQVTVNPQVIFDILLEADFNPVLRQALAAAVDDPASLLRLAYAALQSERTPAKPSDFSAGLYAAASCEELAFPWAPTAPFEERVQRAQEAAAQAPVKAPFATADLPGLDWIALCLRWPLTSGPRPLPPPTDVPALLLSGEADLRTPLEDARRVAAQLPRARLVRLRGVGHSVTGTSGCAQRIVRAYLRGAGGARSCPRQTTGFERGIRRPPLTLSGAEPRRTLRAVEMTLDDADLALAMSSGESAGGLRGGTVTYSQTGYHRLRNYEYVPGIRVTTSGKRFRVSGPNARAMRGRLR
jgi:pimeloyl-ACP methyl ester carboxylesterase